MVYLSLNHFPKMGVKGGLCMHWELVLFSTLQTSMSFVNSEPQCLTPLCLSTAGAGRCFHRSWTCSGGSQINVLPQRHQGWDLLGVLALSCFSVCKWLQKDGGRNAVRFIWGQKHGGFGSLSISTSRLCSWGFSDNSNSWTNLLGNLPRKQPFM